mmetsp:Transcript_26250/g.36972  ORF Transcript_26250/g.36972 Transcript_26250/m.36972 type:complete len:183 (+) Transcript_26250:118-666(+)
MASTKPVTQLKPPNPVPAAASSVAGLMFHVGLGLLALALDMWTTDEKSFLACAGFYFKKTVEPPTYWQLILVVMLLGGAFGYTTNLIGVFTKNGNRTRKVADVIGFVVFVCNLSFNALYVMPLEKAVGTQFTKLTWGRAEQIDNQNQLFLAHCIGLGILMILCIQQTVAFKNQGIDEKLKKN